MKLGKLISYLPKTRKYYENPARQKIEIESMQEEMRLMHHLTEFSLHQAGAWGRGVN